MMKQTTAAVPALVLLVALATADALRLLQATDATATDDAMPKLGADHNGAGVHDLHITAPPGFDLANMYCKHGWIDRNPDSPGQQRVDRVEGRLGPETYAKQSWFYGPDCTLELWESHTGTPVASLRVQQNYAALMAGSVTADSISPAGSLRVTTAQGSFAQNLPGQVSIEAVTLTEPATCTKSPSYLFFEEFNELGPHRCKTDCGCDGTRFCSSDGQCQDLAPEPTTCTKSPDYQFDEEHAALGPHRCKTDCGCDGTRFCSSDGQCQDLAPEPATCTKSPDYQFDEEHAALGPHRCKTICGCRGSRTCSDFGYCQFAFGGQPTPVVEGQSPSDSPAEPQQAATEPSSPAEPQQPAPEPSSPLSQP